jgi:hypothetical protein
MRPTADGNILRTKRWIEREFDRGTRSLPVVKKDVSVCMTEDHCRSAFSHHFKLLE